MSRHVDVTLIFKEQVDKSIFHSSVPASERGQRCILSQVRHQFRPHVDTSREIRPLHIY